MSIEESGQEDNDEDSDTMEIDGASSEESGQEDNDEDGAEGVVVVTVHNPEPPKLGVGSLRLALKRSRDLNATVP